MVATASCSPTAPERWTLDWWYQQCRRRRRAVRHALEDPSSSAAAMGLHYTVVSLILASTLSAVLVTVRGLEEAYSGAFQTLEEVFTALFTAEILLRTWTASNCWDYLCSPSNVVDVLATLPWYVEAGVRTLQPEALHRRRFSKVAGSFRTLRMVRLVRMVRLAKVARHSETVSVVLESILASRTGLFVLVAFVGMGTVLSATAIYAAESEVPGGAFTSIPIAMWWALTTITTVGYGDMVPTTAPGKCVGCLTMVGGTLIVSLSVAMISSSFTEQYRHKSELAKVRKAMRRKCRRSTTDLQLPDGTPRLSRVHSQSAVKRFAELEELTGGLLAALEGEAAAARAHVDQAAGVARRHFDPEQADILLECLRGQSAAFFRAARSLAEHLAAAEPPPRAEKEPPKGCLVPAVYRSARAGPAEAGDGFPESAGP